MPFTAEELAAMRVADEEIEANFVLTAEDWELSQALEKLAQAQGGGRVYGRDPQEAKARHAAHKSAWYQANRERILARQKAYNQANREKINARNRALYARKKKEKEAPQ